jgi:hypothetical protein
MRKASWNNQKKKKEWKKKKVPYYFKYKAHILRIYPHWKTEVRFNSWESYEYIQSITVLSVVK